MLGYFKFDDKLFPKLERPSSILRTSRNFRLLAFQRAKLVIYGRWKAETRQNSVNYPIVFLGGENEEPKLCCQHKGFEPQTLHSPACRIPARKGMLPGNTLIVLYSVHATFNEA